MTSLEGKSRIFIIRLISHHLSTLVSRQATKKWFSYYCMLMKKKPPKGYNGDPACLQIHHKDGNPKNNCLSNLVWMTANEHTSHHVRKNSKNFYQYT
jgi:hypothetical protein